MLKEFIDALRRHGVAVFDLIQAGAGNHIFFARRNGHTWGIRISRQRGDDHAAQTYERAVRSGNSVYEALELSNAVLYQDLRFSKYDAIFEVVSEWFPEVAARQRTAFCLKLLPVCEEAFEMYDLTDDFESSPSYKNLLLELTGLIQTHIELHGIQ